MMHGLIHHFPQENGLVEWCNRTLREAFEDVPTEESPKYHWTRHTLVQRGKIPSSLGISQALGLLPGRAQKASGGKNPQVGCHKGPKKELNLGIRQKTLALVPQTWEG